MFGRFILSGNRLVCTTSLDIVCDILIKQKFEKRFITDEDCCNGADLSADGTALIDVPVFRWWTVPQIHIVLVDFQVFKLHEKAKICSSVPSKIVGRTSRLYDDTAVLGKLGLFYTL